ncbi:MAG: ppGpp synthetase/RelA/SpoT-type nucleotidyltransferase [Bacillariaceae sp.]|jgi:ppGpp synthetase/RelA/SpoT-type nucleotidyltranferase
MESIIATTSREESESPPSHRRRSLKRKLTKTTITRTRTTMNALIVASVSCFAVSYQTANAFVGKTTLTVIKPTSTNKRMFSSTASSPSSSSQSPSSPTSAVFFTVDEYHAAHHHNTDTNFFIKNPLLVHQQQQQKEQHELFDGTTTATYSTSSDYSESCSYQEYEYCEEEYLHDYSDDGILSIQQQQHEQEQEQEQEELPVWLRHDKGHFVEQNIEALKSAMLSGPSSFFTESEAMQLTYAIQEAAYDNNHKMAGAAEFCLIMVETMEMGLNALIAAAFHYCECIDARERSIVRRRQQQKQQQYNNNGMDNTCTTTPDDENDVDTLSHWEFRLPPQGIGQFDGHAARIERDAARLKRLEVVASMVVHHNNKSLRDLYTTEAKDWRALAIRGAACLYRLRGILQEQQQQDEGEATNNDLLLTKESNRVCREAFHIYAPLASRMGMHRLKNELEHAAFQILYRRQHRTYESLLSQTRSTESLRSAARTTMNTGEQSYEEQSLSSSSEPNIEESMQEILAHVKDTMTEFLNNDAVFMASVTNFEVTARVKESYSTWKKMIRNGFDHITQVPDAMALRIVLDAKKEHPEESDDVTRARERALCYYVQQLCQTVWAPHHDDPRFKDYIAHPKENGYQSLHYTAGTKWRNNEEWKMEMQVRTGAMHKLAEFGVASHWNYKAGVVTTEVNDDDSEDNSNNDDDTTDNNNNERDPFGKVTLNNNNQSSDAYLRSLQDWHWQQHGSTTIGTKREPLVLWDNEAESRERAERIRARTQRLAPYLEALENEQNDLQRKNVFVFLTPQQQQSLTTTTPSSSINDSLLSTEGTVVALPAGSSILDVILKCELPIPENKFVGGGGSVGSDDVVTQNGIPASLSSRLQNGDVLSIPSVTASVATTTTTTTA